MNFILKALSGLAAGVLVSSPVSANTHSAYFQDHIRLAEAVESIGVEFKVNPIECARDSNTYGWYHGYRGELVVCQENGYAGGPPVAWSREDLDTLRHEAHHMVQDCMDGVMDGSLDNVYQDPVGLGKDIIGTQGINSIMRVYSDVPEWRQIMEIEAFSVATMNDPREQISDIQTYCFYDEPLY